LQNGDHVAVKDLYKSLVHDGDLLQQFMMIIDNTGFGSNLTNNQKMELWKYLLPKTYHSHIGVLTDHFAEATTGHFTATAKTDALHLELKIKTHQNTIKKAKSKAK